MPGESLRFLRFEPILYPVWRRSLPAWLRPAAERWFRARFPVQTDRQPPQTPLELAQYLLDWEIFAHISPRELSDLLEASPLAIDCAALDAAPATYEGAPLRLPAQWEPSERVLIAWGVLFPAVWPMHAQMVEAISAVADCEILVPSPLWAQAIGTYLVQRGQANLARVRALVLPTNDVWIRDYGPIVGQAPDGERVALNAHYATLPQYPQALDDAMPARWAAHHGLPVLPLPLHIEGGNLWSDGQGTLLMSDQTLAANPAYDVQTLSPFLARYIAHEKLILTPRLRLEETGHVDLIVKLASADTILVSAPERTTAAALRAARRIFEHESNARGQRYQVIELPTPPLYLNWFFYTIRRHYTNALTVNGRVLVPTFRLASDEAALRAYEQAMPGFEVIPIDSRWGINGGGAVHCMTKEIPR